MSDLPATSIYVKTFAKSDTTDAVLIVNGQKMHVNKANLCLHSEYIKTLFNSDVKGKPMKEIKIGNFNYEEFATLLSLVLPNPIEPKVDHFENLLKLADRFIMPSAKRHVELYIGNSDLDKEKKLKIAEKYDLDLLLSNAISSYNCKRDFYGIYDITEGFSDRTRAIIFDKFFLLEKNKLIML